MTFLWHHALWLLLALPFVVGVYFVSLQRRESERLRYPGLGLAQEAPSRVAQARRHAPALLLLTGIVVLMLAAARPVLVTRSASAEGTIVLLMDVSLSMAASDVPPTRLEAARAAAVGFVNAQPRDVRIGVVAFGGYADIVQPPTANREDVLGVLDRLQLQRFTAIGNGLIGALVTILPTVKYPQGYDVFGIGQGPAHALDAPLEPKTPAASKAKKAVAPGSYGSAAIVLVSDGLGTMGVAPAKAAKLVADAGIRVYTVGVGTLYGGVANVEGWPAIHAEFSEDTLKAIADITRGEYFLARDAHKLKRIYEQLGRRVIFETSEREVTVFFAAIGMILSLASAALSLGRPQRAA